jgi:hypothetical protein
MGKDLQEEKNTGGTHPTHHGASRVFFFLLNCKCFVDAGLAVQQNCCTASLLWYSTLFWYWTQDWQYNRIVALQVLCGTKCLLHCKGFVVLDAGLAVQQNTGGTRAPHPVKFCFFFI